jgi:hypothetical protein
MMNEYPRILRYIELVEASRNENVELLNFDFAIFSLFIPECSLDPVAQLKYETTVDDLVPLVLRFTNPETGANILVAVIYRNLSIVGICVYDPENNLLALKYFNGNKFLIRVGVSKIDEFNNEVWLYDNYFQKDEIIILSSNPQKYGRIWFTRPFKNL